MNKSSKNRITKYITYYLGEVIVVITGILIAFQLNNYKENVQKKELEKKSISRLISDLEAEKQYFVRYTEKTNYNKKKLIDILFKNSTKNLDSLYWFLAYEFVHYSFDAEYSSLKFSGQLNLISSDSLRINLIKFYEHKYSYFDILAENHEQFVENELIPYLDMEFQRDTMYLMNHQQVISKLNHKKLKYYLTEQIRYTGKINQRLNIEVKGIENLINELNDKLK